MQVEDKVFVVTGAGNGIGREVVLALVSRGARVAAVDIRAEALDVTARLSGAAPDRLSRHVVDITDQEAVAALPEAVTAVHGHVDGLLNVAGIIQRFVPLEDLLLEDIDKVFQVNFWGVVHMVKAFLPELRTRTQACIVNVSSMGGFVPVPGQTAYGASKAAVKLLTEGLYAELRGTSVTVTVVFPGAVATEIADNSGTTIPVDQADAGKHSLTSPVEAARRIIEGLEKGAYRVVIGREARALDRLSRWLPRFATDTVAKRMASLLSK